MFTKIWMVTWWWIMYKSLSFTNNMENAAGDFLIYHKGSVLVVVWVQYLTQYTYSTATNKHLYLFLNVTWNWVWHLSSILWVHSDILDDFGIPSTVETSLCCPDYSAQYGTIQTKLTFSKSLELPVFKSINLKEWELHDVTIECH